MAENTFDRFSVFFTGDTVFLDGTVFPLGRLTTDVLNLDSEVLTEIDQRVHAFISALPLCGHCFRKKQTALPAPHRNSSTLSGI